jgi:hypothetical protein
MKDPQRKDVHGVPVPVPGATAEASESLVTKKVVARANSVSTRTVDYWKQRRLIPFVKISARCVRFHLPSVVRALRRLEVREAGRND